jgi:DNA-directed RNA polymerase specialized sigma24 family protein
MSLDKPLERSIQGAFDAIFEALPPLSSPQFIDHLRTASAADLPAQVVARAYRQLCIAGMDDAARAALARLVGNDDKYHYLASVRRLAKHSVARGQYWYDAEDLVQATIVEIVKVLPTPRGALAEQAWVLFSQQRFTDAWRVLNGRRGEKVRGHRVEPSVDAETGELFDPMEETDGAAAEWHVRVQASNVLWLEDFIRETVAKIADPITRQVAEDQFGDDPSPISAGVSAGGKPPLTEQLGVSRFRISRALSNAKARLAGALLAQQDHGIDVEWLRHFLRGK